MRRLWVALAFYAGLAGLAWLTLSDQRIRLVTVAILAMFAIRTLVFSKRSLEQGQGEGDADREWKRKSGIGRE